MKFNVGDFSKKYASTNNLPAGKFHVMFGGVTRDESKGYIRLAFVVMGGDQDGFKHSEFLRYGSDNETVARIALQTAANIMSQFQDEIGAALDGNEYEDEIEFIYAALDAISGAEFTITREKAKNGDYINTKKFERYSDDEGAEPAEVEEVVKPKAKAAAKPAAKKPAVPEAPEHDDLFND